MRGAENRAYLSWQRQIALVSQHQDTPVAVLLLACAPCTMQLVLPSLLLWALLLCSQQPGVFARCAAAASGGLCIA